MLPGPVIMNVVPAQTAGVRSLAIATPPSREGDDGLPSKTILATCAIDRDPAFAHARALSQIGVEVLGHLRCGDRARPAHRLLDRRTHLGVQLVKGLLHGLGRHAEILGTNMVEFLAEIAQGRSASG